MTETPDRLDDLLRSSAPMVDMEEFVHLSAFMATTVAAQPRPRRSRGRKVAIGVVAAAALGVPAVAAATSLGFHTGWFGDPTHNTEDAGTSEYLNMCDPSITAVIRQDQPPSSSPLPAGKTWAMATQYIQAMHASGRASGDCGLMQEIGIKREYNKWGQCHWLRNAAASGGDLPHLAVAGQALRFYADEPVNHATDGGGIVKMDLEIADKVAHGDAAAAARYATTYCGTFGVTK